MKVKCGSGCGNGGMRKVMKMESEAVLCASPKILGKGDEVMEAR